MLDGDLQREFLHVVGTWIRAPRRPLLALKSHGPILDFSGFLTLESRTQVSRVVKVEAFGPLEFFLNLARGL